MNRRKANSGRAGLICIVVVSCISHLELNSGLRYKCDNIDLYENIQLFVVAAAHAYTDRSGYRALFSCPAGLEFIQPKSREHMRFCVENDFREREVVPGGEKEVQVLQSFGLCMR